MLYPREDRAARRLMFICVRCGYEQAALSPVVFKHELIKSAGDQLATVPDDVVNDAALLRSPNIKCPKCATEDGVMLQGKPLAGDEKINIILVCCGCRYKWTV